MGDLWLLLRRWAGVVPLVAAEMLLRSAMLLRVVVTTVVRPISSILAILGVLVLFVMLLFSRLLAWSALHGDDAALLSAAGVLCDNEEMSCRQDGGYLKQN